ncbi:MAG: hypothetical protein HY321_07310 [Armatimonadetes bacterium]|nr:hypothetical protein [Armatimonadota bacterium]
MQIDLTVYELRTLLNWAGSRSTPYGLLGTLATLREVTLADRLSDLLAVAGMDDPGRLPDPRGIREAEAEAARILAEETAAVADELRRLGYEFAYAGVVHSLGLEDPRYWSVVDLQIEPAGAERPTYAYFRSDIPVWREGRSRVGEALRREVRRVLDEWVLSLRAAKAS